MSSKISINLEDIFDFSNLDKNHELFSIKDEKVVDKFQLDTPMNIWIDEFVALRSQAYSLICNGEKTNKVKKCVDLFRKILSLKIIKIV